MNTLSTICLIARQQDLLRELLEIGKELTRREVEAPLPHPPVYDPVAGVVPSFVVPEPPVVPLEPVDDAPC